jgi:nucleoside 2-deoxyribosyltransferase
MKVYIAAPLFSEAELEFNKKLDKYLTSLAFETFLPQRDGYKLYELVKVMSEKKAKKLIFQKDFEEIEKSDIIVFVMDGRVPDEGACVEIGLAYPLGKECIGLKTDARSLIQGIDNPLIIGVLKSRIAKSFEELKLYLEGLRSSLQE